MARLPIFLVLCIAFFQAEARAELITKTFDLPTNLPATLAVPSNELVTAQITDSRGGITFEFVMKMELYNTPSVTAPNKGIVYNTGPVGDIGIETDAGSTQGIDALGEDIRFTLSVNVISNAQSGNRNLENLTFRSMRVRGANDANDSGFFDGFTPAAAGYTWSNAGTGPDFAGHDPTGSTPSFNLFQMNGGKFKTFTHDYVNGNFLFHRFTVSVHATPEPSSWMLGLLAAFLLLIRLGWKRFRLVPSPLSV